jgi:death-on-curing protein
MTEYLYVEMEDALDFCELLGLYIRDEGALASALTRASAVVWGVEAYEGLHAKAAALLDGLNRSHPLLDGNKRLAWTLTDVFYRLNGLALRAEPREVDHFVRTVGGDAHLSIEEIAAWLEAHAVEIAPTQAATPPHDPELRELLRRATRRADEEG